MTRIEHHVGRGAAVTCGPAGPAGTHAINIADGPVTVSLRFGSAEQMAGFAVVPYVYVMGQAQSAVSGVEGRVSTGVWDDGDATTTQAQPADPADPATIGLAGRWLRAPHHLSLGELIIRLEAEDPAKRVPFGFHNPGSYRGNYFDLAFGVAHDITVAEMLAAARSALGATYQGWKGGDYLMSDYTSCWLVAERGDCGESLGAALLDLLLGAGAVPPAVEWTRDDEAHHQIMQELRRRVTTAEATVMRVRELAARWQRMRSGHDPAVRDDLMIGLRHCHQQLAAALDGTAPETAGAEGGER